MKCLKVCIGNAIYLILSLFITKDMNYDDFVSISYLVFAGILPYNYVIYKCFWSCDDEFCEYYKKVNDLYKNKKKRYKNLYSYFYHFYISKDLDDQAFLRTVKAGYISDNVVIPLVTVVVTICMFFLDKFKEICETTINILVNLLKIEEYTGESVIHNSVSLFTVIILIILIWMILKIINIISEKAYIKSVLDDIEKDMEYSKKRELL